MSEIRTYRDTVEYYKHPPMDVSGYESDDLGWADLMIIQHILDVRTTELKRQDRIGFDLDKHNQQTLPCIKLEEVDKVDNPCAPPTGCIWLKSTEVLPRMIKMISVTSIDGNINFNSVDWTKFKYKKSSRIKSNKSKKYYTTKDTGDGTFLYVLNDEFIKAISLTSIFEDPYAAVSYPNCGVVNTEAVCNPWSTDMKTDRSTFATVMSLSWSLLPNVRAGAGSDIYNDSTDNTKGVIQPKI